jgi:hypothetical protein
MPHQISQRYVRSSFQISPYNADLLRSSLMVVSVFELLPLARNTSRSMISMPLPSLCLENGSGMKRPVALSGLDGSLRKLTSQLPSLQIFVCSSRYACGMAKSSLDVVVWTHHRYPNICYQALKQTAYIQNTRVLSLDIQTHNRAIFAWSPMFFPRLESLYLQVYSLQAFDQITRNWELPNLQICRSIANLWSIRSALSGSGVLM